MSRSRKGNKPPGWEWWSKRPMSGSTPSQRRGSSSPTTKQICRRIERARRKADVAWLTEDELAEAFVDNEPALDQSEWAPESELIGLEENEKEVDAHDLPETHHKC